MPTVILTGANGFIGRRLEERFLSSRWTVHPVSREQLYGTDIAQLPRHEVVVHSAAMAHVANRRKANDLEAFRVANRDLPLRLARSALAAGCRHFIFLSSIGAVGVSSHGAALAPDTPPSSLEPYGLAKREAEDGLVELFRDCSYKLTIIRPPLVHGPHPKGNFLKLLCAIAAGRWLPFGAVDNRRSFIGVENLVDAVLTVAKVSGSDRHARLRSIYHVADDGVVSTRRLIEVLAEGMSIRPRLVSVPKWLTVGVASLVGKGAMARRLFADLEVDDHDFRRDFAWKPAISLEDGLRHMAAVHSGPSS